MATTDGDSGRDGTYPDDSDFLTTTANLGQSIGLSATSQPLGLSVLHSPDRSLFEHRLIVRPGLCLGRSRGAEHTLVIRDPRISRPHARFEAVGEGGDYEVIDLRSRNGTFVDGEPVMRRRLQEGAIVRLGDTFLEFARLRLFDGPPDDALVGWSSGLIGLLADVKLASESDMPVLLLGEAGSGKSLVAERIHALSGRRGPFVAINCGAIPAELVESYLFGHRKGAFTGATADVVGVFEKAAGGTLFLDEVGALGLHQQPKLLRVLEQREFSPIGDTRIRTTDAHIVAATNANLQAEVFTGAFRHDLFTRLAGFVITVSPLRQRRSDVPQLARHFLSVYAPERRFDWTPGFIESLLLYDWPGNVRELRFLMERLALRADERLSSKHIESLLPGASRSSAAEPTASPQETLPPEQAVLQGPEETEGRPSEKELAARLTEFGGNVRKLARHYGKDSRQVYRWMKACNLRPENFRTR